MATSIPFVAASPDQAIAEDRRIKGTAAEVFRNAALQRELKKALPRPPEQPAKNVKGKPDKIGSKETPPKEPDKDYKWNLPPHQWSLPVRPITVQPELYEGGFDTGLIVPETYRRGRMWWYYNTKTDYAYGDGKSKKQATGKERKYGFQFLWNPESYSTSVQLNTEVTPHPSDKFAGVAGVFPSGENISFTLRLDRTNDFYCMRNLLKKDYEANLGQYTAAGDKGVFLEKMAQFYKTSFFVNGSDDLGKKIRDLAELGTIADLEYLFVAVNGPGWKNIIGRPTGDIGFLSATLLRIDIGPASYVGYINSLTVNHLAFSQDMTPIRTDVQISMNLMASAGLAAEGTAAAIAPNKSGKNKRNQRNRSGGGGGTAAAVL